MSEHVDADVGVIIVAAGSSTRMASGELKQFRWIAGKPMLLHSVQSFQARADVCMVVAVVPPRYAGDPPPWLFQSDLERLLVTVGGRERGDSVRAGLDDLPPEARVVLVHDAARPFPSADMVDRVIAEARAGNVAIPGIRVVDTLKRVDDAGTVTETVHRAGLWRAQTPQGFPREVIDRVHEVAVAQRLSLTDDAALCEHLGIPVRMVQGSELAMKVTEEEDFERLTVLIEAAR